MSSIIDSPPRAPPVKYKAPLGTRWEKEKAAAGTGAFDYPDDAQFVGPWIVGECVGKGASGHVKIARHRRTGQLAAVKILPLQPFVYSSRSNPSSQVSQAKSEKQRLGIDREITMMKLMDHPNVMRIYDVYEGEKELYLILEYVEGGELFDFLVNRGKLAPLEALGYFKQIVYGLNYAHTFSIIHRDLKPENILIHSLDPPLVKIADWGMAAFAPPTLQLETSCGSPHYASPEIVNGHRYTGTATDIWSCGVILYALLTGRLPFDDKNVRVLLGKVKTGRFEMPLSIDPLAKDLLSRMLVVDVKKRITMSEILTHPWLEGYTPGITYVPAPPVSELAKPLQSVLHIDRDLFQSICVIWGRHADPDTIKTDLLSPEGEGILAKAFYFLLNKHRDRAMEEYGIVMDDIVKSPGKVVTKQYSAPKSRIRGIRSETAARADMLPLRTSRTASTGPSRTPSPNPPIQLAIKPLSGRDSLPAPIGSRARSRPTSSPVDVVMTDVPQRVSEVQKEARSNVRSMSTDSAERSNGMHMSDVLATLPQQVQSPHVYRRASALPSGNGAGTGRALHSISQVTAGQSSRSPDPGSRSSSAGLHSPVPRQATQPQILPMITAPRVPDAELQKTFDDYANMVNAQAQNWNLTRAQMNTMQSPTPSQCQYVPMEVDKPEPVTRNVLDGVAELIQREEEARKLRRSAGEDKENVDQAHVGKEQKMERYGQSQSSGLGFGSSVAIAPLGKEMANLVYANGGEKEKKEKKHRASTLELVASPPLHKRSTFSAIGSPSLMSPQQSSLLGSPAVGEFKGWFQNLFHWKVQSYVLYSVEEHTSTRAQLLRILDAFGVIIFEDASGVLKCRVEDVYDGSSQIQKQVRFRVEVSSTTAYLQSGTPRLGLGHNHNHSQTQGSMMSPPMNVHVSSVRTRSNFERIHGFETVCALILEKGSLTTFKHVCQRVKKEWTLDGTRSPSVGGVPMTLDQRVML
ncbi:kinase-like domain-containing protein [Irpex rosettiformis]|uniref:Kinase-like domain-containing protein n=1 Tax=Irpex rosettiformis TaxID=378272 RepID=A0ACB8U7S4_9APHY|nr:kinase-like domain-containing protein [Irpex rosettiformis]